jgi:hypothetical protein
VLGLREDDVCFSAAKLFFAYGLGNALTFPMSVGATTILMAERPTPEAVFKRWTGRHWRAQADGLLRRAHRLCRHAGLTRACPRAATWRCAWPPRPARRCRPSSASASRAHFGVDIVDGIGSTEMLHIFLSNRPGRCATAPPAGRCRATHRAARRGRPGPVPDGEPGDLYIQGPSAAMMYWGNREKTRDTFQGGWTKSGDKYLRNADGSYTYGGRSDDMLKVSGIYVSALRGRGDAGAAPGGAGGGGDRRADAEWPDQDQGLRGAQEPAPRCPSEEVEGLRQGRSRPTSTRARSPSSTSCPRRPPARSSASSCASVKRVVAAARRTASA